MLSAAPITVELVVETDAHEGPVYVEGEHALYFTSTAPGARVKRLDLDTREVADVPVDLAAPNGMTLDRDGRLLVCEQGSFDAPARIASLDPATGEASTVVAGWGGRPLNSPNDVIVARDGAVWFTDPSYGHLQGFRPSPLLGDVVYRHDRATGESTVVAYGFDKPNGLCFSPDESLMYVNDSERDEVIAYDVDAGRRLRHPRRFAFIAAGHPDGMKTDGAGRLYVAAGAAVLIFDPGGEPLGEIAVPGAVNLCFARNVLFVTNDTAVWAAVLEGA